jgi:hypothetical protein
MATMGSSGVSGSHDKDEHYIDYAIDQQCIFEFLSILNCMFRVNYILANVSLNTKFIVIYFNKLHALHIFLLK